GWSRQLRSTFGRDREAWAARATPATCCGMRPSGEKADEPSDIGRHRRNQSVRTIRLARLIHSTLSPSYLVFANQLRDSVQHCLGMFIRRGFISGFISDAMTEGMPRSR